jgi:hypothetical protein
VRSLGSDCLELLAAPQKDDLAGVVAAGIYLGEGGDRINDRTEARAMSETQRPLLVTEDQARKLESVVRRVLNMNGTGVTNSPDAITIAIPPAPRQMALPTSGGGSIRQFKITSAPAGDQLATAATWDGTNLGTNQPVRVASHLGVDEICVWDVRREPIARYLPSRLQVWPASEEIAADIRADHAAENCPCAAESLRTRQPGRGTHSLAWL